MAKEIPQSAYTYIRIATTFGLTMGMNIYVFSILIGGWLDRRFDTEPLFRLIFLFVALGMGFFYLFKQVQVAAEVEKENKRAQEKERDKP